MIISAETTHHSKDLLLELSKEFADELHNIGDWWLDHSICQSSGGFYGEIDHYGNPRPDANKGLVLNARILWFFSELAMSNPDPRYTAAADRAYDYLQSKFYDPVFGGYWWELDSQGEVVQRRKQVYGQAFVIYAYSSYYLLNKKQAVLDHSLATFKLLQTHSIDPKFGGFWEAFAEDWSPIQDFRLSEKDLNFPKTMNTHLHVLEAYTNLHRVVGSPETARALRYSLDIFVDKIFDHEVRHLKMFLDAQWQNYSPAYSYGHDIEASWLLWEAAEVLGDTDLKLRTREISLDLACCCLSEAVTSSGALLDEKEIKSGDVAVDFPWWVQAEALVGFVNAFELSKKDEYLKTVLRSWSVIKSTILDKEYGEWCWFARSAEEANNTPLTYKAGAWKAPYHNGRAMLEMTRRLKFI